MDHRRKHQQQSEDRCTLHLNFLRFFTLLFLLNADISHAQYAEENIVYTYDELGRLTLVEDSRNTNRNYFYDAAGNRTYVALGNVAPILQKPTGLGATQISNCAWRASWATITGATYYIFRSTAGVDTQVSATYFTFDCPPNSPNSNRPNWVQACNTSGCSEKSYF